MIFRFREDNYLRAYRRCIHGRYSVVSVLLPLPHSRTVRDRIFIILIYYYLVYYYTHGLNYYVNVGRNLYIIIINIFVHTRTHARGVHNVRGTRTHLLLTPPPPVCGYI